MRFVLFLLVLLFPCVALANPFLVSDPTHGADYFTVQGLPTSIPASHLVPDPTGKFGLMIDLASLPPGDYTVTAKACAEYWGCSPDSPPLSFTRPKLDTGPVLKLSK